MNEKSKLCENNVYFQISKIIICAAEASTRSQRLLPSFPSYGQHQIYMTNILKTEFSVALKINNNLKKPKQPNTSPLYEDLVRRAEKSL